MKKRNHKGIRNPHWGHIMSEDRVREIIKETVQDYLANNAKQIKDNNKNIDIRL